MAASEDSKPYENPDSITPLALPSPDVNGRSKTLTLDHTIKLDELGPMVVNSDGTLSRIANWKSMTQQEQERTMRVLGARNKIRIANEEKKLHQDSTVLPETKSQ